MRKNWEAWYCRQEPTARSPDQARRRPGGIQESSYSNKFTQKAKCCFIRLRTGGHVAEGRLLIWNTLWNLLPSSLTGPGQPEQKYGAGGSWQGAWLSNSTAHSEPSTLQEVGRNVRVTVKCGVFTSNWFAARSEMKLVLDTSCHCSNLPRRISPRQHDRLRPSSVKTLASFFNSSKLCMTSVIAFPVDSLLSPRGKFGCLVAGESSIWIWSYV